LYILLSVLWQIFQIFESSPQQKSSEKSTTALHMQLKVGRVTLEESGLMEETGSIEGEGRSKAKSGPGQSMLCKKLAGKLEQKTPSKELNFVGKHGK